MEIIDDDDDPTEEEINNLADKIEADRKNGLVDMTASIWKVWAVDAGCSTKEMFCYIPVENAETGQPTFVTGMNVLASPDEPPGNVVMVIHPDGDETTQKWCDENSELLERLKKALAIKFPKGQT